MVMDNSSDSEWGSSGTSVMMIKNFPIQINAGNLTSYDLLASEKKILVQKLIFLLHTQKIGLDIVCP